MRYINTTFAHGNGPYARDIDWAIEVNNVREGRGLNRLPIVVPLVYGERQQRIMKEEIESNAPNSFLEKHPDEIWLDQKQGEVLNKLMFKGKDYSKNLMLLAETYQKIEDETQRHLDGKRKLENFVNSEIAEFDLRDAELQLGLNNRMQTGISNQFYTAGGAGPFDEILERAISNPQINLDEESMKKALPIAKRIIENQKIIFSNDPGVFSYDSSRQKRDNEIFTPGFIHPPKPDYTELPGKGIYLLMTGIDGIRESGMYDAVLDFGMKLFAPKFSINNLSESIRNKVIPLNPSQINNPNVVAQYARSGWSTVWLSQMAEKGFISPPYQQGDDPEMLFNEKGIVKLGLGTILRDEPQKVLEKAIGFSKNVGKYNKKIISTYGTLDGIRYAAEIVVDFMEGRNVSKYKKVEPVSNC